MKLQNSKIFKVLFYCGLTKEEYGEIKYHILKRNLDTLKITSFFCFLMGLVFLIIGLTTNNGVTVPYIILAVSGIVVFFIRYIPIKNYGIRLSYCYLMMIAVFVYAFILSTNPRNVNVPATSIVVFLALFPLTIDDKPIKMISIVLLFSVGYVIYSKEFKTPEAFNLDLLNTATFSFVGMLFYVVICNRNVHEIYQSKKIDKLQKDVISSLAMVIEERDESTGRHILRVESYIKGLTNLMKEDSYYEHVSDQFYDNVYRASPLHDIGKIKVPDRILNKPSLLDKDEYEIIKKHALEGAEIINRTMKTTDPEYFQVAYNIALSHHERWDGTGYPNGIKGEQIPLEARIMALADVYDALVSERIYKKAYSKEVAIDIIQKGKGTQFDPRLTDLFIKSLENDDL